MKKKDVVKKAAGKNGAEKKKEVRYTCNECGLSVIVDENCGLSSGHELLCCNTLMEYGEEEC